LAKTDLECRRQVHQTLYDVSLYIKEGRNLGLAGFKIGPQEAGALDQRIEDALGAARLVKNQPFELPENPSSYPDVEIYDSSVNEHTLAEFEARLINEIKKEKNIRLSSAEFFIDQIQTRLLNHRGLDATQKESSLYMECILLAKNKDRENEFINRVKRRLKNDLKIEEEVRESARMAREATRAAPPKTGTYPVLLTGEPLDNLFAPLLARASARFKYLKMLAYELGREVVDEGEIKGDKITLWSNGLLKGGLGTNRFDSYGTPSQRLCLIHENKLNRYLADKRYSDYLNVPVTGEMGNVEIEPGKTPFDTLKDPAFSQSDTLLLLEAFSAFEPNPITGAFSAEIRTGVEISPTGVRPLKGGAVSGHLQKDLLHCHLSKEQVQRERGLFPKGVLFHRLTIAGD